MFSYVKRDPDICQKRHQMRRLHDVGAPSNKASSSATRCCVSWSRREGRDAAHTHETHIYTSWPKRTHTYVLQTIGIKCIRIYAGKWRGSVCFLPARQARFVYDNIHMSWWWTHYIWMRKNDGAVSCVHLVVWCTSDVSAFDVSFDWYKGLFLHVGLFIQASSFDVLCQSNLKSLQLMSCVHLVVWWTSFLAV